MESPLGGCGIGYAGAAKEAGGASINRGGEEYMIRKIALVAACLFLALPILT